MKDIVPLQYKVDILITPNFVKKRFDKISRNNSNNSNNNNNNNRNTGRDNNQSFPTNNNFASYRSGETSDDANRFVPFERPWNR